MQSTEKCPASWSVQTSTEKTGDFDLHIECYLLYEGYSLKAQTNTQC